jgi:cell division protein FtsI (penicillin-binding protein 3)
VFAEVAQQVLEYLGIQHDIDLRVPKNPSKLPLHAAEDDAPRDTADINALFTAINDLPPDDPLRAARAQTDKPIASASQTAGVSAGAAPAADANAEDKPQSTATNASFHEPTKPPPDGAQKSVAISDAGRLRVPTLIGLPIRRVIEETSASGLAVQIAGNGTVREQAPAPGTLVRPGTQIIVRAGR